VEGATAGVEAAVPGAVVADEATVDAVGVPDFLLPAVTAVMMMITSTTSPTTHSHVLRFFPVGGDGGRGGATWGSWLIAVIQANIGTGGHDLYPGVNVGMFAVTKCPSNGKRPPWTQARGQGYRCLG